MIVGQTPLCNQYMNEKTSDSTSTDRILVESFSNLLQEMWRGGKSAINPSAFKVYMTLHIIYVTVVPS